MENRLFIASYEDINTWGKRADSLLNTLEESDQVFLIANQNLNKTRAKMIEEMKSKARVRIMDLEDQNSGVLGMMILREFLKKEEKEYTVYIIGPSLKCIYHDAGELKPYTSQIIYHHNFQVKRLEKKNLTDNETENNAPEQMVIDAFLQCDGVPEEATKTTSKKQNSKESKGNRKKNDGEKGMKSNKKVEPENKVSLTKQKATLEQSIFGSVIEINDYQEEHSELEDARGYFIAKLQDRTESHIRQALFEKESTITLTQEQFYDFITLMMSSDDAKMFMASWSALHTLNVEMTDETFCAIYPEVKFFNDVCEMLYERDYWSE